MQESEAWLRSPEPLVQKHCPAQHPTPCQSLHCQIHMLKHGCHITAECNYPVRTCKPFLCPQDHVFTCDALVMMLHHCLGHGVLSLQKTSTMCTGIKHC